MSFSSRLKRLFIEPDIVDRHSLIFLNVSLKKEFNNELPGTVIYPKGRVVNYIGDVSTFMEYG